MTVFGWFARAADAFSLAGPAPGHRAGFGECGLVVSGARDQILATL